MNLYIFFLYVYIYIYINIYLSLKGIAQREMLCKRCVSVYGCVCVCVSVCELTLEVIWYCGCAKTHSGCLRLAAADGAQ